jgi:hypothetical protein
MIPPLFGKQEVGILTGQKTLPMIWGTYMKLVTNIRFLPSIVAEKNATKNGAYMFNV